MILQPTWPAPTNVRAFTTLRQGGVSHAPYSDWNLAFHVGDNPQHVTENRQRLQQLLNTNQEPIWIEQTHSNLVVEATLTNLNQNADASFTNQAQQICAILTADCLPILLCDKQGTHVAAIHAGWRGIFRGIIAETITQLNLAPENLLIWLGPAIGPQKFEVRGDVYHTYLDKYPDSMNAFTVHTKESWLADIYELARKRLHELGIKNIYGGEFCTMSDPQRFFSYRRDQGVTGRMASLVWLT